MRIKSGAGCALRVLGALLAAAVAGCASPAGVTTHAPGPGGGDPTARAEAEARHADLAMAAAVAASDVEAFVGHVAVDGIFFGGRGPAPGRAAVALAWAPYFAPDGPRLAWAPDRALAAPGGDLVFTFGAWTLSPAGGGSPRTGRYLTAWRRDADGLLRVALDGGHDALPPLPASVTLRSLRTVASAGGALLAEGGLILDGPREAGWYLRFSKRDGVGYAVVAEGGAFRPAAP